MGINRPDYGLVGAFFKNIMIEHLLIASLWIWGFHGAFESKHLLGKIGARIQIKTSISFCRPLFLCPTCMSSVHGGIWALIFYGVSWSIIPFMICLAGLNYIVVQLLPE